MHNAHQQFVDKALNNILFSISKIRIKKVYKNISGKIPKDIQLPNQFRITNPYKPHVFMLN